MRINYNEKGIQLNRNIFNKSNRIPAHGLPTAYCMRHLYTCNITHTHTHTCLLYTSRCV